MKYKNLFTKGNIGKLEIKNRTVMPAMDSTLASTTGEATPELIRYFEERAKGGTGLLITEITRIDNETGIGTRNQLAATDPEHILSMEKLANAVHRYGAKIFVQLQHPGAQGTRDYNTPDELVSASDVPCKVIGVKPRALTTEEVSVMAKKFIKGAKLAQIAGIDGVEIHGAHGYLMNQFLSPLTNLRTDKYGGSFDGRMTFITEIVQGIKFICGPDFPVSVRISADEFLPGGITLDEGVKIAKHLESIGVDVINVSSGTYDSGNTVIEPMSYKQGWRLYLARAVKAAVKIPVIGVGVIREPEFADKAIERGDCDFVALGRPHLADPEWSRKASEGREKEIRHCISCMYCWEEISAGRVVKCAVNPRMGRELVYERFKNDGAGRAVAVIGGGPSGMEAARVLALRGFKPVLYEKSSELGGQVQMASVIPLKEKVRWLINTQKYELECLGVEIRLNTAPSIDDLKVINPYAVLLATGAVPSVPPVPGADNDNVFTIDDILRNRVILQEKKVTVIGSGLTGLETAEFLAENGNTVTIIEKEKMIGPGIHYSHLLDIMPRLKKHKVEFISGCRVTGIKINGVEITTRESPEKKEINSDAVVLSTGARSERSLLDSLNNYFSRVIVIGDAEKPGKIGTAIYAGFDQAFFL